MDDGLEIRFGLLEETLPPLNVVFIRDRVLPLHLSPRPI